MSLSGPGVLDWTCRKPAPGLQPRRRRSLMTGRHGQARGQRFTKAWSKTAEARPNPVGRPGLRRSRHAGARRERSACSNHATPVGAPQFMKLRPSRTLSTRQPASPRSDSAQGHQGLYAEHGPALRAAAGVLAVRRALRERKRARTSRGPWCTPRGELRGFLWGDEEHSP